jgi:arylsulfatase A-like enzyme
MKPLQLLTLFFLLVSQLAAAKPRNLLIIQSDEHNFRTLGCYRDLMPEEQAYVWGEGVKVDTPHIDSIANEGAICTSFYATSPVCTPSRASLLTGLYPQNTGSPSNNEPLLDSVETIAEVLRQKGYATGYAGKWHLDGSAKPGWAPKRKFGFEDNRYMFNRGHWKKLDIGKEGPFVAARSADDQPTYGVDGADETTFATDFLADRTIDFIHANKDKPFCYMVSIPDPHGPNTVRPPYDTMFDPAPFRQPLSALAKGNRLPSFATVAQDQFNAQQMAKYFGMVKCIDDNIGRIRATLKQLEIDQDTIIVFTSDHGDMCGELGRHNKGIPCEGSARIPFLLRAPGIVPCGTVLHEAMGTVDFKPTLLNLLETPAKQKSQGRDLSQLFRDGKAPEDHQDITFVRIGDKWFGAFTDRYKLVVSKSDDPALYDLHEDPNELNNTFHQPQHRELVRDLAKALKTYAQTYNESQYEEPTVEADLE